MASLSSPEASLCCEPELVEAASESERGEAPCSAAPKTAARLLRLPAYSASSSVMSARRRARSGADLQANPCWTYMDHAAPARRRVLGCADDGSGV